MKIEPDLNNLDDPVLQQYLAQEALEQIDEESDWSLKLKEFV